MAQPREVVEASTARLSRERYLAFLDEAKGRGFEFVCFRDFLPGAPPLPSRYIALRHDVDFAPEYSLEMAELDHDAGVASTFFVLVDGGFYNPLDSEIIEQIRRIHTLGHEVGLHFAVSSAVHADLGDEVAFRLRLLRDILGAPVRSFSQHDPANAGLANIDLPPGSEPCVDAYQVTREHDLLYVSESAMMWREHTFETALDENRNLALVAHAHSWLAPEDDYVALIRSFQSREVQATAGRFEAFIDALARYYERRLAERA